MQTVSVRYDMGAQKIVREGLKGDPPHQCYPIRNAVCFNKLCHRISGISNQQKADVATFLGQGEDYFLKHIQTLDGQKRSAVGHHEHIF